MRFRSARLPVHALLGLVLAWTPARAEDATAPPDVLVLDVCAAIERALDGNQAVRRARNALASVQSTLRAEENGFDFKLSTAFVDDHDFVDDRWFGPLPDDRRDVVDDEQSLAFGLSRDVAWGGRFEVATDFSRTQDQRALLDPSHSSSAGLGYTQSLWRGRGKRVATASLVAARTDYRDAAKLLAETESSLAVETTRAFFAVVVDEKLIAINEQAVADARDRLKTAQLRLNEGLITPIEVSRADRDLKQRESQLISAQESLSASRDQFLLTLGIPLSTPFRLVSTETFEPVQLDEAAALAEARERRADLAVARSALDLAGLAADVARNARRPQVDVTVAATYTNVPGTEGEKWFDVDPENALVGRLVFSHVFGEKSDDESYVRARIAEDQSRLELEQTELVVAREVRDSLRSIRSLERQIEVLDSNRRLATESLRLSTLQFEEGLISTADLTVDQLTQVQAETDYVNALYDHVVAKARLELVLGRYRAPDPARRSPWLREERQARGSAPATEATP